MNPDDPTPEERFYDLRQFVEHYNATYREWAATRQRLDDLRGELLRTHRDIESVRYKVLNSITVSAPPKAYAESLH